MPRRRGRLALLVTWCVILLWAGCAEEREPGKNGVRRDSARTSSPDAGADASLSFDAAAPPVTSGGGAGDATTSSAPSGFCRAARSSEPIPARDAVMSQTAASSDVTVFVSDIFGLFNSICGGCHVDGYSGGLHVGPLDFPDDIDQSVVDRITTSDPNQTMPPISSGGMLYSKRPPTDQVVQLVTLLKEWIAAGRPRQVFYLPAAKTASGVSPYLLSTKVGQGYTNIGDCVPDKGLVATEQTESAALDDFFAKAQKNPSSPDPAEQLGLPLHLEQTDLTTFDTETLARRGVVAYAPTYPLWSDNARKLRHVRVPRGQSIQFDPKTQSFTIPPNTRFYKTFFKSVVESSGAVRYRKMETRLIVARPNVVHSDGTFETTALFGTYEWNDDETEATLLTEPLRDNTPFGDKLKTYYPDEVKQAEIAKTNPKNLTYALEQAHAIRRYAIPGRDRCIECHMGSATKSFSLGFLPVQMKRRPAGEGGVLEPAGPDELTQLQRFIDYGLITGIDSVDQVQPLEAPQGGRSPRNSYELLAQGYMLGNCSHCHNPNGYPSVQNPVLAPVLNFLPGDDGGIFQFPLELTSPRIFRAADQSIPIPYITPSLVDLPPSDPLPQFYSDKGQVNANDQTPLWMVLAPWRSLIYRNVDTPFSYSDDFALFPHMPMNTPGYDGRVARILGDWMVSIPAKRKNPELTEFAFEAGGVTTGGASTVLDTNPQPYVEVKPSDPDYATALAAAQTRLREYHEGINFGAGAYSRYDYCPDTSDIIDPQVEQDPESYPVPTSKDTFSGDPPKVTMPGIGVPVHAHWVVTDLTQVSGPWAPRRPDWEDVLVNGNFPQIAPDDPQVATKLAAQAQEKKVVQLLKGIHFTEDFRQFALQKVPFGLWQEKAECAGALAGVPTVGSLAPAAVPRWIAEDKPPASAHLYMQAPGESVFDMICINCHGPKADGQGRQADTLLQMTGGNTRVADLRDGLFGPTTAPGDNRQKVFGSVAEAGVSGDDFAARYLAWMGLGGTQRVIPASVLAVVSNTEVLGQKRKFPSQAIDANMLSTAFNLCMESSPSRDDSIAFDASTHLFQLSSAFIQGASGTETNGDAGLWRALCTFDNPHPIAALYNKWDGTTAPSLETLGVSYLYARDGYPKDAPVGDQDGNVVTGLSSGNVFPWCVRKPLDPTYLANATAWTQAHPINGQPWPFCPENVVPPADNPNKPGDPHLTADDLRQWATRGAINAGFSVFAYVDQLDRGATATPAYDHCEQLNAGD
ncbi:MAG TPA: hypothetical protein VHC69_00310 [Polyangiaceae bacterium]|nr:hypothetical protein [Polyangiaceae bacterium]